jgi:hypothetical protein
VPNNVAVGLAGMAARMMEDVNFALKKAFAPLTRAEIDRLQTEAESRRALAEAATAAQEREWQHWLWLEEQRRRQYQQEIEAVHARARRRRATIGPGVSLPPFAAPLPEPRAKSQPAPAPEIQPLHQSGYHHPAARQTNRGAAEAIKKQFRQAAKQTVREEDKSKSRGRRRRGETEGQFRQLMRRIMRRFDMRPQFRSASSKTGRRSMNNAASPDSFATGSPWSNPLNGMDFYAGDLAGFSDSDEAFHMDLLCDNSLER